MLKEIEEWFKKHGSIPELQVLELISDDDRDTYQVFELNRTQHNQHQYLDPEFDIFSQCLRVPEYDYDAKDHCHNCGYFEPDEYNVERSGYCVKLGENTNPRNRSCHLCIIL
jgi:hypothetical protein